MPGNGATATAKVRRQGSSLIVTIPHGIVERLGIREQDLVEIELRKVGQQE